MLLALEGGEKIEENVQMSFLVPLSEWKKGTMVFVV